MVPLQQGFSNRQNSASKMNIYWNISVQKSSIYSKFKEPGRKLAEPLGFEEPGLKNTAQQLELLAASRTYRQLQFKPAK